MFQTLFIGSQKDVCCPHIRYFLHDGSSSVQSGPTMERYA